MKLILAFSDLTQKYHSDDIVIYGHPVKLYEHINSIDVNSEVPDEENISSYYDIFIENIKYHFPKSIRDIILGSHNNLYTNHLSLFKWAALIDKIISENDVEEVIITDLIEGESYAPYYEAEGEAHKRFFYKAYDFIPKVMYRYLLDKHEVKPRVLHYRSRSFLFARKFIRRYILIFIKLVYYYIKLTRLKYNSRKENKIHHSEIKNVIISRSIAHFDAIEKLHNKLPSSILFCGESGFTFGHNYNFSKNNSLNVLSFCHYLSWRDILKSFYFVLRSIYRAPGNINIEIMNVTYSYSDAVVEMCIAYFEVSIMDTAIKNFLSNQKICEKSTLYTCEMYTPFTKSISNIGNIFKMTTVQLQTTNMFVIYEPNYIHCDYFIFNSKALSSSYKKKYPNENKTPFLGNFTVNNPEGPIFFLNENPQKVLYFTQPLTDEDIEQKILEELIVQGRKHGFLVHVKLHPRDNKSKLARFINEIKVIDASLTFDVYMEGVDLVVLKTSSIASKVVLRGIPIIFCLYSDWARNGKLDYIDFAYGGTTTNLKDIQACLADLPTLKKSFIDYRQKYIVDNGLDSGVEDFVENIQEFIL